MSGIYKSDLEWFDRLDEKAPHLNEAKSSE